MYPTAIAGIVLVICAAIYAWQPDARRLRVVLGLEALTFLVGCLGFVTGMIKTTTAHDEVAANVIAVGFGESLHNVAFALCMIIVATIELVVGLGRTRSRTGGTAAVDPLRG
jgi:hypothetical protein